MRGLSADQRELDTTRARCFARRRGEPQAPATGHTIRGGHQLADQRETAGGLVAGRPRQPQTTDPRHQLHVMHRRPATHPQSFPFEPGAFVGGQAPQNQAGRVLGHGQGSAHQDLLVVAVRWHGQLGLAASVADDTDAVTRIEAHDTAGGAA